MWIEIVSPDNETLSPGQISLYDNGSPNYGDTVKGDKIYSNLVVMKSEYINGMYSINYFVEDKTGTTKKVASQSFHFDRGEINISPIIVSVSLPDTIEVKNVPLSFIITATLADSNGIKDISEVYFITIKPDLSTSGTKTSLYDDGNYSGNGDAKAGDGIYSRAISISPENQKGKYRFDFQAKDRGGLVSQVVQKYIVVK